MYVADIKKLTKENANFRKVLHTGEHSQIVAMSLNIGEGIGLETHDTADQILCLVDGEGRVVIDGEQAEVEEHAVVFIPAGAEHDVTNTGDEPLKLFTIYAPATHAGGTVQATKAAVTTEEAAKEFT